MLWRVCGSEGPHKAPNERKTSVFLIFAMGKFSVYFLTLSPGIVQLQSGQAHGHSDEGAPLGRQGDHARARAGREHGPEQAQTDSAGNEDAGELEQPVGRDERQRISLL